MKGLLVRDLRVLKNQIKGLGIGCAVIVIIQLFSRESVFVLITCFVIAAAMLAANTISFDEVDGGFSYLFTLPTTRKSYVDEKYVVGTGMVLAVLLAAGICMAAGEMIFGRTGDINIGEMLLLFGGIAVVGILYVALMIPLYLKFGTANGKLILPLAVWGMIALVIGIVRLNRSFAWNIEEVLAKFLQTAGETGAAAAVALILLILIAVSWFCSRRIIEKKEF